MLHGFSFSRLVLLSTLIFTYWNASNSHLLQYRDLSLSARSKVNQNDSDVTCSRSCDQGKITKRIERQSGLRKTRFFKRTNHLYFVFLSPTVFVFLKRNRFLFFSELLLLHHAISPFSELHNNNLLHLLWHSKLSVKKCIPSLFLQSVVDCVSSRSTTNFYLTNF